MSKLTYRWAAKHLPLPAVLKEAVERGHVHRMFANNGQAAFVISPRCPNRTAVLRAIEIRKSWELWVARAEGFVVAVAVVALVYLALPPS